MMPEDENPAGHERFRELVALAPLGALTREELGELRQHLPSCADCRNAWREYRMIERECMPVLAASYEHAAADESWDESAARWKLLSRVNEMDAVRAETAAGASAGATRAPRSPRRAVLAAALAASLALAFGIAAWNAGSQSRRLGQTAAAARRRLKDVLAAQQSAAALVQAQAARIAALQEEESRARKEVNGLRRRFLASQARWNRQLASERRGLDTLAAAKAADSDQLRALVSERNRLSDHLREARRALRGVQTELTGLRAVRDASTLRQKSLE
jgi:pyruvate/2-oxoglutarate dehydrogenase complex dihydrolipoamide acyltransferase (E2) component